MIQEVLTSLDRILGVQGLAGTGKTTVLSGIRESAKTQGYKVEGIAPTSLAAGQLREEGIDATTLQSFLARKQQDPNAPASRHLYMLDESSLASTKQMRTFLEKIGPQHRVLVIGDTAQHRGVDAGRPFEQMQDAGIISTTLATDTATAAAAAPLEPPPTAAPPPVPMQVSLGMMEEQVLSILGQPNKQQMGPAQSKVYIYHKQIVFQNGKVSAMRWASSCAASLFNSIDPPASSNPSSTEALLTFSASHGIGRG